MTLAKAAEALGLSVGRLSDLERGRGNPTLKTVDEITWKTDGAVKRADWPPNVPEWARVGQQVSHKALGVGTVREVDPGRCLVQVALRGDETDPRWYLPSYLEPVAQPAASAWEPRSSGHHALTQDETLLAAVAERDLRNHGER